MKEIVQKDNPVLRKTAHPVPVEEIASPKIQKVIHDMKEAMYSQEDAVGIAAPQIGVSLQIFIVSGKVFAKTEKDGEGNTYFKDPIPEDLVALNPEIVKHSRKLKKMEEGCLSVRWLYGEVARSEKVVLRAHDENGKIFTRGASGLGAQVFQHEVDHLHGVLFIDKAEHVREIVPEETEPKQSHGDS